MTIGSSTTACFSSVSFSTSLSISLSALTMQNGHVKLWSGGISKSHSACLNIRYLNEPSCRQVFGEKSEKTRMTESSLSGAQWLKQKQEAHKLTKRRIGM